MKRIKQTLAGNTFAKVAPHDVSAIIFSQKEFDFTIEALKAGYNLTDEQIQQARK